MTQLAWGLGARKYETGVDRGVLYPSVGHGVSWNGLISVEEQAAEEQSKSYYIDGKKYLDVAPRKDYKATLRAFSFPNEFLACLGERQVRPGFSLANQPRTRFGLSYRTLVGSSSYKIHLVYNAITNPISNGYSTIGTTESPVDFEFEINAVPPRTEVYRPYAHLVVDSALVDPVQLAALEDILYGHDGYDVIDGGLVTEPIFGGTLDGVAPTASYPISMVDGGTPASSVTITEILPYLPTQTELFALLA
jgi:hypothetical protein